MAAKPKTLTFDLDDDDLKLFTEEADEQIELLDTALVQLESDHDPDLVQQIFRAAHTLKGSSATIGHKKMAQLTHAMETVLDAVRQGKRAPDGAMVDALLAGLDALRVLAREVVTRIDSGTDISGLESDLLAILDESAPAPVAAAQAAAGAAIEPAVVAAARSALAEGLRLFEVSAKIGQDCALPSIRCYQLLQELDSLGTVLTCDPERSAIESGAGEFLLTALVSTGRNEHSVRLALEDVPDVEVLQVRGLQEPDLEARPSTAPTSISSSRRSESATEDTPAGEAPRPAGKAAVQSVRIDVERLDGLMNLVGELVIDRTRLQQIQERLKVALKDANLAELMESFDETTSHLARVTDDLQEGIMRSRMLPIRSVFTRLPRLVRDVASKGGKRVELLTSGEETEFDRSVIEEISDPLVHILRNAVDHGIETPEERAAAGKPEHGTIWLTAWNQEASIYLSIRDDGRGIDTNALRRKAIERGVVTREAAEGASEEAVLQYIFFAGLSTAKSVSDVSGRGVGMDIVRTNIERVNGRIEVRSSPGKGSEFILQLPLTLATTKALMVMANETVYALPLVSVTEALAESDADIHAVAGGKRALRLRGRLLPLVSLAESLGDATPGREPGAGFVVAARHGERHAALVVDRLLGEQDVVVKSFGDIVGSRKGLTGATILGDGTLGLIVDTASLVNERAGLSAIAG